MGLSLKTPHEEVRPREDWADDAVEVPATVLCAICGDPECPGCERDQSRSGIVAMVAWERPGTPPLSRMWATARATTMTGEAFFELLPDGPIAPAVRFAMLVEIFAAFGFVLTTLPFVAALAPGLLSSLVRDDHSRGLAFRVLFIGVPALAVLLVLAHAAHGLALDRGARKVGARSSRTRALRFGLYATGWDLVLGPIGAIVIAFKEGIGASLGLLQLGVGLPGRCTRAFLRGAYRLDGESAEKASGSGMVAAVVATIIGAVLILAGAVALVIEAG